jgi:diguanylate cyclase (GGDEF)-like protein
MQTDLTGAMEVATRVCRRLADEPVKVDDKLALNVTLSGGVAVLPVQAQTGAELVAAADKALYVAKKSGRNRVLPAETPAPAA